MKKLLTILFCISIIQLSYAGFLRKTDERSTCNCQPNSDANKFKDECFSLCDYEEKCEASEHCFWAGR